MFIMGLDPNETDLEKRLELHDILVEALGSTNVYYQPPASVVMSYPCLVYTRSDNEDIYASNSTYIRRKRFTVTVIDRDPDSDIPRRVSRIPYCSFKKHYIVDSLNHDTFELYI